MKNNNTEKLESIETKDNIYYSKYYWYIKYKERYFQVFGYGAGIDQEEFKLIEEIENELEGGVDWDIIQVIEESNEL
ncbi:hypothetical protein NNC19_18650 [Clostridium sp. SHJSY1]|uniref:hypothetical protein n=1 Tax=Clostridium sp. SHJSY1 TaxID=2942483 RepID=UPI002876D626|nr:hypothetical protein [Clostridium sp. SHJSY1]MDS0527713.1 hypothetical protein [Clostridium sp. SHJSY1]